MGNINKTIWPGGGVGVVCTQKDLSSLQVFSLVSFSTSYGWSKLNETSIVGDLS